MIGAVRSRVPPDEVLEMFDDAVGAFVTEAGRVDDWDRPACGNWTGTELARHVLSVIGWYHDWLDRAEAGDSSPAFRDRRPRSKERPGSGGPRASMGV